MKWKELVIIYRLPLQLNDGILPTVGDHNQQQKRDIELYLKKVSSKLQSILANPP